MAKSCVQHSFCCSRPVVSGASAARMPPMRATIHRAHPHARHPSGHADEFRAARLGHDGCAQRPARSVPGRLSAHGQRRARRRLLRHLHAAGTAHARRIRRRARCGAEARRRNPRHGRAPSDDVSNSRFRADDAERIAKSGKRIVFQSIENSYPLGKDVTLLKTLLRSRRADGRAGAFHQQRPCRFRNRSRRARNGTGCRRSGKQLVAEANRLGIILDASHASDETFDQMLALSTTPIMLSHSSARAVFNHPRNIDDARIEKLAAAGGVIQINSYSDYLIDTPDQSGARTGHARAGAQIWSIPQPRRRKAEGLHGRTPRNRGAISPAPTPRSTI